MTACYNVSVSCTGQGMVAQVIKVVKVVKEVKVVKVVKVVQVANVVQMFTKAGTGLSSDGQGWTY